MWVDLVSMMAVGVMGACAIFITRRSLARKGHVLARWVVPAFIGLCMIGYSVWNEYSWFGRMTGQLPVSVAVVGQGQRSDAWAPWTYAWPVTTRFVAMDTRNRVRSSRRPGLVITELLLVERWQPTRRLSVALDCHHSRRAELARGAHGTRGDALRGARWQNVEPHDPILLAACAKQAV